MSGNLVYVLMGISFVAGGMCGWLMCAHETITVIRKMTDEGRAKLSDYDILFKAEGEK